MAAPDSSERMRREITGIVVMLVATVLMVALLSHSPEDPSPFHTSSERQRPENLVGWFGAALSATALELVGTVAFALPMLLMVAGWRLMRGRSFAVPGRCAFGWCLVVIAVAGLLDFFAGNGTPGQPPVGGIVGDLAAGLAAAVAGPAGCVIGLLYALIIGGLLIVGRGFSGMQAWRTLLRRLRLRRLRSQQAQPDSAADSPPGHEGTDDAKTPQRAFDFVAELGGAGLPAPSLLEAPQGVRSRDPAAAVEQGEMLERKCREFGVRGKVSSIRSGPRVITFEFRPEAGIRVAAIQRLEDDLALALRSESVRVARLPGRAVVGIEVPEPQPETIRLRSLISTPLYETARSPLTLCLGVDVLGNPVITDLARMPHLLVAGFTGSGKSVGINAMLLSILYRARPDEVRLVLIDPKRVELGLYADIPHLLTPVVTDPKRAANALGWAVAEMERRYELLAEAGLRDRGGYQRVAAARRRGKNAVELEPMPLVVIVIDELADLMLTSGRAVEEAVARIAQKARAVGIHLVCATQRPSVDVVTGMIKANFPCRLAFKMRTGADSRTILDTVGAERLLERGDMLFIGPGSSRLVRVHGPLVSEQEVARVTRHLKRSGRPSYADGVQTHRPVDERGRVGGSGDGGDARDPMYDEALALVVATGQASASFIQRRLQIGYNRAARLLEAMERAGVVGPPRGAKPRELLIDRHANDGEK